MSAIENNLLQMNKQLRQIKSSLDGMGTDACAMTRAADQLRTKALRTAHEVAGALIKFNDVRSEEKP